MAKIKLTDYLKSKKRREAVYESDESIADRVRAMIDADSYAVQPRFRVENYRKALALLEQIPDYPETCALTEQCRQGLEQAEDEVLRWDYSYAKYHLETADAEYEFRKVSDELTALSDAIRSHPGAKQYEGMLRDTEELKKKADAQIVRYAAKTNIHRWAMLLVIAGAVAGIVYAWTSGYARYLAAKFEGMGGIYQSAYSRFYKLGDYLDSRSQYEFYKKKYLRQRENEERRSLPDAEVGDTVAFSDFSWLVLEKDGSRLRMICTAPKEGSAFSQVSYDGVQKTLREEMSIEPESESEPESEPETARGDAEGDVPDTGSASWEKSSLRRYLNETVLHHEFTPAEITAMLPQMSDASSNPEYGTKLDLGTEDLITILSVEEERSFREEGVFKKPSVDMWMRTPGHDPGCAAYLTSKGNEILYGNDVTDDSLSACPLITVDYEKLEG